MKKVTPTSSRKEDHIRINLEEDVRSGLTTGLEKLRFEHEALPDLDLEMVDLSLSLFGRSLQAPILISSMTGGTEEAERINLNLAAAAQESRIAMGVGSQRAALRVSCIRKQFPGQAHSPRYSAICQSGSCSI